MLGFGDVGVWGLGFGVWGLGFGVWVEGFNLRVSRVPGLRIWGFTLAPSLAASLAAACCTGVRRSLRFVWGKGEYQAGELPSTSVHM